MTTLSPEIRSILQSQAIELPSWAFGNSGKRFRDFATPGTQRDACETIAESATVRL